MKRKSLFAALCALLFLSLLCGCSSFRGVRAAFEHAGYVAMEDVSEHERSVSAALGEHYFDLLTVRVFVKENAPDPDRPPIAVILEFDSYATLCDCVSANNALKLIVSDPADSPRVSGNCLLFLATDESAEALFSRTR